VNRVFFSVIFVFLVLGSLAVLQATRQTTAAVLMPSELSSQQAERLKRIRVGGRVVEPIDYQLQPSFDLKFNITDPPNKDGGASWNGIVPVRYKGLKPDMFAAGRDVIVEGEFKDGAIEAKTLLTQCPSKYEPPDPNSLVTKDKKS
jgi:cytochrome c-type biogenesis protein CcmE